ncbi:MAG TPA: cyclic nucleotide-binding domain-containing protein [Gaiellaceae bacterium]|jgi:voltage-gated potassium channel
MPTNPENLVTIPLFASLSDADRDTVAVLFEQRTCSPGERLVGEGAHGYSFFVLQEGEAVVTADGEELGTLGPGDFFGEIALIGNGRRTATVTATSEAKVLVMFGTDFRLLQQRQPKTAALIEAAMRARLS